MVLIPSTYECKDQRNQYKCIKNTFNDYDDCKKSCPGKCKKEVCHTKTDWYIYYTYIIYIDNIHILFIHF